MQFFKFYSQYKLKIYIILLFLFLSNWLYAQTNFPVDNYWSIDIGVGTTGISVEGISFHGIIDPRIWLSPSILVGSKVGINYSFENSTDKNVLGNILTIEGQSYLRWNFLRLGKKSDRKTNIFFQGGVGLIVAYRGESEFLDLNDVIMTRGSVLADFALGITIPITSRWHIEPIIRGGYPHIWGFSLTTGFKFPLYRPTNQENISANESESESFQSENQRNSSMRDNSQRNSTPQLGTPTPFQQTFNTMPAISIPLVGKSFKFELGGDNWIAKVNGENYLAGNCIMEETENGYIINLKTTHVWSGVVEDVIDLLQKAGIPLGPAAGPLRTAARLASIVANWIPLNVSSIILEYNNDNKNISFVRMEK